MKTDNELIARFMGAEFVRKPHVFYPDQYTETYIFKGHPGNWRVEKTIKSHMTAPMLAYHTDWDWLMPVVDRIEKVGSGVEYVTAYRSIVDSFWHVDILDTYKKVVEFIKWFNKQSK